MNWLKKSYLKIDLLMNTKEAIVLAGGLGTRLQSVLPDTPKCMAPVKGIPFLVYVLDYLITQNISKVILSVSYRKEQIINYFGNKYKSLFIEYAVDEIPMGTGGALRFASKYCSQDEVFVINGDTYFIPDLEALQGTHRQVSADITIAVKYMQEPDRYGVVQMDKSGRITDFKEKDIVSGSGWINGGIYLINRQVLNALPEQKFSLENDVFKVSCSVMQLQAFQTEAFFLDMGVPEDYERAQSMISIAGEI